MPTLFIMALCTLPGASPALPDPVQLHQALVARYRPMHTLYRGIETRARIESTVYHAKTRAIDEQSSLLLLQRGFYDEPRETTVLEYRKNGQTLPPDEYKDRGERMPAYSLIAPAGPEQYRLEVLRRDTLHGQPCLVVRVIPRAKTRRHFGGLAWLREEPLELLRLQGELAATPTGVSKLSSTIDFDRVGDYLVARRSETTLLINVPIFFPHRRIVSTMLVSDSNAILR